MAASPPPENEPDPPLLTVGTLRALKREVDTLERQLIELPAQLEFARRRLDAAKLFMPEGMALDDESAPQQADPMGAGLAPHQPTASSDGNASASDVSASVSTKLTWRSGIESELIKARRGITHKELLDRLIETPLGGNRSEGNKGFYNAIARLEKGGTLVKAGGLLYHSATAAEIVAQHGGLPNAQQGVRRRQGGAANLVIEALRGHPGGLTGTQLSETVSMMSGAPKSLTDHRHYIYNILSNLMGSGTVTKWDGLYRLTQDDSAEEEEEPDLG